MGRHHPVVEQEVVILLEILDARSTLGLQDLQLLFKLVKSTEIRDYDIGFEVILSSLCEQLSFIWENSNEEMEDFCWKILLSLKFLPEFDNAVACQSFSQEFVIKLIRQFECGHEKFISYRKDCVLWIYYFNKKMRSIVRPLLGGILARFTQLQSKRLIIEPLLEILLKILSGIKTKDIDYSFSAPSTVYGQLLLRILLPLHSPNEMVDWRDQIPVIQCYHEVLVKCIMKLADKEDERIRVISQQHQQHDDTPAPEEAYESKHHGNKDSKDEASSEHSKMTKINSVLVVSVEYLLRSWPEGFGANTPKEVILLHELETLLAMMSPESFTLVMDLVLSRMCSCLGHDNARPMQRTLTMFKNDKFVALLKPHASAVCLKLLPPLYRGGKLFWNPTVNKMTALVLNRLKDMDAAVFEATADSLFGETIARGTSSESTRSSPRRDEVKRYKHTPGDSADKMPATPPKQITSLRSPNKRTTSSTTTATATATVATSGTVSPLAAGNAAGVDRKNMMPPTMKTSSTTSVPVSKGGSNVGGSFSNWRPGQVRWMVARQGGAPPVTVTGVAPWAMHVSASKSHYSHSKHDTATATPSSLSTSRTAAAASTVADAASPAAGLGDHQAATPPVSVSGLAVISDYIARCLPPELSPGQLAEEAAHHWSSVQAQSSPTLLPDLRFHDLVFGRDLGSGTFATVRYARHILKEKTRSQWPEYAVKILPVTSYGSGEALSADSVLQSNMVARNRKEALAAALQEIAVLKSAIIIPIYKLLTHPGIARLVSAFRYTGSLYLVLEYGALGDLHSHVLEHGPLLDKEIKFVISEVLSALLYLTSLDLSFNDLKPENVIITEANHMKLADFGACRAMTERGKNLLRESASSLGGGVGVGSNNSTTLTGTGSTLLSNLRDGDWRDGARTRSRDSQEYVLSVEEEEYAWRQLIDGSDDSMEGTPAYLPPELLRGGCSTHSGGDDRQSEGGSYGESGGVASGAGEGSSSDAWALGCVLRFLFEGRPPFFGDKDQVIHQHMLACPEQNRHASRSSVSFTPGSGSGSGAGESRPRRSSRDRYGLEDDVNVSLLEDLIGQLMRYDPRERLTLSAASSHPYLTASDSSDVEVDVLQRHNGPPVVLERRCFGRAAASGSQRGGNNTDAWAQRQFSVIWSPLPAPYTNSASSTGTDRATTSSGGWNADVAVIVEEDEDLEIAFLPKLTADETSGSSSSGLLDSLFPPIPSVKRKPQRKLL